MKPAIAKEWVAKLRSGDYLPKDPTCPKIKDGNTFSVLGVLCEVHRLDPLAGGSWVSSYYVPEGDVRGDKYWLPEKVIKWAGVRHKLVAAAGLGVVGVMEDRGSTHDQIADIIDLWWDAL